MPQSHRFALALGLSLLVAASAGQAQTAGSSDAGSRQLARADRQMLVDIAQANAAEIATGKLALEKSQNASVKQFAQKMIDDHTQGLAEVTKLASAKGVEVPGEPDVKHKAMATAMGALSGESFDKQYMAQAGLRDHRNTHELLQKTQRSAKDPELKALATKMMPVVGGHLRSAEQMAKPR